MAEKAYLSAVKFAEMYGISERTAARWRKIGEGPRWVRLGPRRIVYRLADCEAWAAESTVNTECDRQYGEPAA